MIASWRQRPDRVRVRSARTRLSNPRKNAALIAEAVKRAAGRVPVLSGVAEMSTAAACQYVRDCETLGADGFMVMPAMVYKADAGEAVHHFRRVAAATGLPWMLYNNPVGYPVDITPAMFAELADMPNLVAIKESSANTRRITELRHRRRRPLRALRRRRRPDPGIGSARHRRLGGRARASPFRARTSILGPDAGRPLGRGAGHVSLVLSRC